jgi:hypothetical protein
MAVTWHRRLVADLQPPKTGVNPRAIDMRLWWTKQHWNRSSSKYFAFDLSVSFHIHSSITDVMISETESIIKQHTSKTLSHVKWCRYSTWYSFKASPHLHIPAVLPRKENPWFKLGKKLSGSPSRSVRNDKRNNLEHLSLNL